MHLLLSIDHWIEYKSNEIYICNFSMKQRNIKSNCSNKERNGCWAEARLLLQHNNEIYQCKGHFWMNDWLNERATEGILHKISTTRLYNPYPYIHKYIFIYSEINKRQKNDELPWMHVLKWSNDGQQLQCHWLSCKWTNHYLLFDALLYLIFTVNSVTPLLVYCSHSVVLQHLHFWTTFAFTHIT